jgi:uncharacterized SAM-binding protein YcdF (DUF218 family)
MMPFLTKILWFFAAPSNVLPTLGLLGLLLISLRRRRRAGLALAWIGLGGTLLAGFSPLSFWATLPLEQRFPRFQDDGAPVHGVVVLSGAVDVLKSEARHQLELGPAAERITALLDLARRYPEAKLVYVGGSGSFLGAAPRPESLIAAEGLEQLGLARERLVTGTKSRNTAENAQETRALIGTRPGERWLLVTSAWHMPRAVGCFRQAGLPVVAYPVDFRTRGRQDVLNPFTEVAQGLVLLDLAIKEWIGLVGYRLLGWTDRVFPNTSTEGGVEKTARV